MSLGVPAAKQTSQDDKFAEMIGVVVCDEKCLTEEILAFTPAERFVEIGLWIFYEGDESFEISVDGSDRLIPGMC